MKSLIRNHEVVSAQDRELEALAGLNLLPTANAITARVVDRDPGNFESTLTIDRGGSPKTVRATLQPD